MWRLCPVRTFAPGSGVPRERRPLAACRAPVPFSVERTAALPKPSAPLQRQRLADDAGERSSAFRRATSELPIMSDQQQLCVGETDHRRRGGPCRRAPPVVRQPIKDCRQDVVVPADLGQELGEWPGAQTMNVFGAAFGRRASPSTRTATTTASAATSMAMCSTG